MKEPTKEAAIFAALIVALSFFLDNAFFSLIDSFRGSFPDFLAGLLSNSLVIVLFLLIASAFLFRKTHHFLLLWVSVALTTAITYLIKFLVARPRPAGLVITTFFSLIDYSFPSNHAAIMFATIYILARSFPKWAYFFITYATLVALSRVYLRVHHLSDVLAGAAIGFFIGYLIFSLWKRTFFDKLK